MKYVTELTQPDRKLAELKLSGFLPAEIYDIHAHPCDPAHFAPVTWKYLEGQGVLGCAAHRAALSRYMPVRTIHGLYFGLPHKTADRPAVNSWIAAETKTNGTPLSRALLLVSPDDDPQAVAAELRSGRFCGLKVYHCYAGRPDTMNARISEFTPEWMWELLHEVRGVLMLHLVREGAITDADNQAELRRFCRTYPNARLVLPHIARSFNYRHARSGLHVIADLDNAVVDTSAICESEAFRAALKILGPRRVLWGSDFPICEARGRCVTTGASFFWLHPEALRSDHQAPTATEMTLVGIESLLCLREACEDAGLTRGDIEAIFLRNALRTLSPHLPISSVSEPTRCSPPPVAPEPRNLPA